MRVSRLRRLVTTSYVDVSIRISVDNRVCISSVCEYTAERFGAAPELSVLLTLTRPMYDDVMTIRSSRNEWINARS